MYLGNYEDEKAIPTLRLLDMLHSDGLTDAEKKRRMREEFGIAITESIDKEVTEMCNWSQGIKEEYLTKGRREGRKEGIDIGEKRGINKGRRLERQKSMQQIQLERQRTAKNLLSLGMSFEQAVEALGLTSPEDIERLRTHV